MCGLQNKVDNIHRSSKTPTYTGHFHSSSHQKWLPYPILGGQTVKNVQSDPQTTDIGSTKLKVTF